MTQSQKGRSLQSLSSIISQQDGKEKRRVKKASKRGKIIALRSYNFFIHSFYFFIFNCYMPTFITLYHFISYPCIITKHSMSLVLLLQFFPISRLSRNIWKAYLWKALCLVGLMLPLYVQVSCDVIKFYLMYLYNNLYCAPVKIVCITSSYSE